MRCKLRWLFVGWLVIISLIISLHTSVTDQLAAQTVNQLNLPPCRLDLSLSSTHSLARSPPSFLACPPLSSVARLPRCSLASAACSPRPPRSRASSTPKNEAIELACILLEGFTHRLLSRCCVKHHEADSLQHQYEAGLVLSRGLEQG
jgi:hypothetical protein